MPLRTLAMRLLLFVVAPLLVLAASLLLAVALLGRPTEPPTALEDHEQNSAPVASEQFLARIEIEGKARSPQVVELVTETKTPEAAADPGSAQGQNADPEMLEVSIPFQVFERQASFQVNVTGADIYDLPLALRVIADRIDITSGVSISVAGETRRDRNSDDLLESYNGRYEISLGAYDLVPGQLLVTEVSASAPGGFVVRRDASRVASHAAADPGSEQAQNPNLEVSAPVEVLELQASFDVDVTGAGIDDVPLAVHVFADSIDITSEVSISVASETRVDSNSDYILESYYGQYEISFGTYDLVPGQHLVTEVSASAPGGSVARRDATQVASHMGLRVDSGIRANDDAIHVAVHTSLLAVASQTLTVHLDNIDVTSQVCISGPELVHEDTDSGSPAFANYRMQRYWVDISSLGNVSGRLRFTMVASASGGGSTTTATTAWVD